MKNTFNHLHAINLNYFSEIFLLLIHCFTYSPSVHKPLYFYDQEKYMTTDKVQCLFWRLLLLNRKSSYRCFQNWVLILSFYFSSLVTISQVHALFHHSTFSLIFFSVPNCILLHSCTWWVYSRIFSEHVVAIVYFPYFWICIENVV